MFEAKMMDAAQYMWKVLASAWNKKSVAFDPLQVTMDFKRNFPQDSLSCAQTAQALIAAGVPKQVAWSIAVPEIDDADYVMEMAKKEAEEVAEMYPALQMANKAAEAKAGEEETEDEET